jgi:hypothetical protein
MSAESIMESLKLNFAKNKGDKAVSRYVPHNNYCIDPTDQDLKDMNKLDSSANTNRFNVYQSELDIMSSDMQRLKTETDSLLSKERAVYAHKDEFVEISYKKNNNLQIQPHEQEILMGITIEKLEDWCLKSTKLRSESQARKIHMMGEIDKLEKKCSELLSDSSSNMIYRKDGRVYLKFTGASMDEEQPNKRPKEAVALFFVRMLTKVDKLIKISLEPCLDLLKEYRDCYEATHRTYKMFNVAITRIEQNKNSLTRFDLTQLVYDLLTSERQVEYLASIKIAMESPESKKEMLKLASSQNRELADLKNKVKNDQKKGSTNTNKGRVNKWQNNNRGKRFSYPSRGNRQNNFRGRAPRGNFGNRGRGYNRNYQRYNNQGNGYYNQRFNNNSYRTDNNNHSGDGNNFNSGNSGNQPQFSNNTQNRGSNQTRGTRGGRN